jgi:flagellar hook-associated protein 1 FlgK
MSLSSLLNIARTALLTHKRSMEVTAHNVANAQTPGYSRQRLMLRAQDAVRTAEGWMGRGVTSDSVARSRDIFFDAAYRRESGRFSQASTLSDGLRQIEDAMGEPSDVGLSAALDRLFNAFSDLANDPSSPASRDLVGQAGGRLAQQMNQLDQRVSTAASDALSRLQGQVSETNELLREIGQLNRSILAAGGNQAVDLQDQRDNLVDRVAEMMSVRVIRADDGTVSVLGEGGSLVNGVDATQLSVTGSGANIAVSNAGGNPLSSVGGSMGALIDLIDVRVPALKTQLDSMAAALVSQVNAVHRTGYTATGATNTDFFDPAGVTAATIGLAATVSGSSAAIAAAGTSRLGDGTVALQLAQLGSTAIAALSGRTFRDHYSGAAASIGLSVQGALADTEVEQALMGQADQRRAEMSGVSVDEEMVNLIAQQQAYGAAAKLIGIADDMMQLLLQSV